MGCTYLNVRVLATSCDVTIAKCRLCVYVCVHVCVSLSSRPHFHFNLDCVCIHVCVRACA